MTLHWRTNENSRYICIRRLTTAGGNVVDDDNEILKLNGIIAKILIFSLQVVPYKECKQSQVPQEFDETKLAPKKFIEKECTQSKKEIPHKKLLPECKNVTKQNCVTNWETDSYGNQVN